MHRSVGAVKTLRMLEDEDVAGVPQNVLGDHQDADRRMLAHASVIAQAIGRAQAGLWPLENQAARLIAKVLVPAVTPPASMSALANFPSAVAAGFGAPAAPTAQRAAWRRSAPGGTPSRADRIRADADRVTARSMLVRRGLRPEGLADKLSSSTSRR